MVTVAVRNSRAQFSTPDTNKQSTPTFFSLVVAAYSTAFLCQYSSEKISGRRTSTAATGWHVRGSAARRYRVADSPHDNTILRLRRAEVVIKQLIRTYSSSPDFQRLQQNRDQYIVDSSPRKHSGVDSGSMPKARILPSVGWVVGRVSEGERAPMRISMGGGHG